MKCLILAAGYATRLYPLTENFPKPLLKVGEKSILDWLVDDLVDTTDIDEFVVISNHKFAQHFEDWKSNKQKTRPYEITVIDDGTSANETRLGAVKDIQLAVEKLNLADDLLVMAGDNVLDFSLSKFVDFAKEKNTSCVMCHEENELKKQQKTAIITLDNSDLITSYEEKPKEPKGNLAVPPFYCYRACDVKRIQEALNNGCGYDAPGSFAAWLSKQTPMHAYVMPGKRYDIGDINSYEYSRKTKLGRVEWNPGTLAGVLANERHCGDVLARKTFTPNFLTHKSKKNNNDRTQYRQKNHHEAIVSREVFNAANHLRASRNYSKKNRPLPVLSVVEDGILRGYVPFDKDWTGFSAEEYREASESVMKEPDAAVTADVKKRLDLTGYEVVRAQYFSTMQNPAMTISNGRLRFNTACLKKFENVEYVELLLNSVDRCIAIRPCDKNNPNAIRWGRLKEGRWCASTLGCRGLAKALFDIMEWDEDLRYRFRGQFLEQGDNKMMLFAFDEPEMIKVEEIVLPPKENTEEDEGETVRKKIYIFPPEWAGTFGQPITSIAQVGILRQEHYAGNWDVFRPASEIEEMNTFTAESLNKLLHEAEKIMEGWTDIDE